MLTETNPLQNAHTAKTKTKMTNDKWGGKGVHKSKCSLALCNCLCLLSCCIILLHEDLNSGVQLNFKYGRLCLVLLLNPVEKFIALTYTKIDRTGSTSLRGEHQPIVFTMHSHACSIKKDGNARACLIILV